MLFARSLGRWAVTALVINCVVGSGIFGIPTELTRLVGWLSPLAMIAGCLAQLPIIASSAEVASQFSEPGGAYLYTRTVFGRFAGIQVGWFSLLAPLAGVAANPVLFVTYFSGVVPGAGSGLGRAGALAVLIALPAAANCAGVGQGSRFSSILVVAKLLPMLVLIVLGMSEVAQHGMRQHPVAPVTSTWSGWISALLLLAFAYGGYEDALVPAGEVKNPRRTLAFSLGMGLTVCALLYTLLQFVTVSTIGLSNSHRPLADVATLLIGKDGAMFVSIAVMLSTYGNISAGVLTTPRLAYSLAANGDFPPLLGWVHPQRRTPFVAIMLFCTLVWLLAETGTFRFALALSAGSMMVMYAATCGALLRLRRTKPDADALRVPFGRTLAYIGILIACVLLTQLTRNERWLMLTIFAFGALHWCWVRRPFWAKAEPRTTLKPSL